MDSHYTSAVDDLLQTGLADLEETETLDAFLTQPGLAVLFFTGGSSRRRESHDVAVALREILHLYPDLVRAAVVHPEQEAGLQERFRVIAPPSLVFVVGGQVQEVLPGVRDWGDYARAFQRYLGKPAREARA